VVPDPEAISPVIRDFLARNFLFSDQGFDYEDSASLLGEGIIDSMGIIELVSFVEQKFAIPVADEELLPENFDSVSSLSAFVSRRLGAGHAQGWPDAGA
jgi:acyl carrier protein